MTFRVKNVHAYNEEETGNACDNLSSEDYCDPYIKVFINRELVYQSEMLSDTARFNADYTYKSKKIPKSTIIRVEVWDYDSFLNGDDDLIQQTEGNIESFLAKPVRDGNGYYEDRNFIETVTFWQDEYNNMP